MKRALAGIFVACMETGRARQDANDITHARDYFELAIAADPDSVWALTNLAVARAADGDKKAALEALRRTKQKWTDRQAFSSGSIPSRPSQKSATPPTSAPCSNNPRESQPHSSPSSFAVIIPDA